MRRLRATVLGCGLLLAVTGPAAAEPIQPEPLPHSRGGPRLDPQGERPGAMPQVVPEVPGSVPIPLLRPPPLDPVPMPEAGSPAVDDLGLVPRPPQGRLGR